MRGKEDDTKVFSTVGIRRRTGFVRVELVKVLRGGIMMESTTVEVKYEGEADTGYDSAGSYV